MSLEPRSVIVPIAGLSGGTLIELRADDAPPPSNDEGFDPQLAKLFGWGSLYQAGGAALAAVRRLRLGSVGLGPLRMLRGQPVPGYLSLTNTQDVAGLDPANSRSAELGLAVALIAYGGQSSATAIAATGELDTNALVGQATHRDVAVKPVGRLATKLSIIANAIEARPQSARTDHLLLFLPQRTEDNRDPLEAHLAELDRLRSLCEAQDCKLTVLPVATVAEAVAHLGIRGIHATPADRAIGWGLGAVAAMALGAFAWSTYLSASIRLAFDDIALADGTATPSPIRASFEPGRSAFVMSPACLGEQSTPVYRAGESLIVRVSVRDRGRLAGHLGGYHFIAVGVSEVSGAKVLPPVAFAAPLRQERAKEARAELAAGTLSLSIPIVGPAERAKLFVLAKRGSAFDAVEVRKDVEAAISGKPPTDRINAATVALTRMAPGYIDYAFRSAEGDVTCAPL